MWPIVYFDGIVVHVRGANGRVSEHTIYVGLGVNLEGKKELLGLWLSENEGAKFWLSCLTDLRNRGLTDIFVVCVDGLAGFPEAIRRDIEDDSPRGDQVANCLDQHFNARIAHLLREEFSRTVAKNQAVLDG